MARYDYKLIQLLPENSVIKAHPSFMINSEKIESLEKFINKISLYFSSPMS